jgi:hypothetical protein
VLIGLAVVSLVVVASLILNSSDRTANPSVLAGPSIDPGGGMVVFSDDFRDDTSGWTTGISSSTGTTYEYSANGYTIVPTGDYHHFAYAPYRIGRQQLSITMTASQTAGGPSGSGFGILCRRGTGATMLNYEFIVFAAGSWAIERRDGTPDPSSGPRMLDSGAGVPPAGPQPDKIEAVCATIDSQQTRLMLLVNGSVVDDFLDIDYSMPTDAWLGGIITSSRASGSTTVTVTQFEERDLGTIADPGASGSTSWAPDRTASSGIDPNGGSTIFTDDFRTTGWPTGDLQFGSTARYTAGLYTITVFGNYHHVVYAPGRNHAQQLAVTVVASQDSGRAQAGYGVVCTSGNGPSSLTFEFLFHADGSWDIERFGGPADSMSNWSTLASGPPVLSTPASENRIEGVCATTGSQTALDLYVNDRLIAEASAPDGATPSSPWIGGIDVQSDPTNSHSVTLTYFEERDLSR